MENESESSETYLADIRAIMLLQLCILGICGGVILFLAFAKGVDG